MKNLHTVVLARKEDLLKEAGMEGWQPKADRLEELVSKFTILTHKQFAGGLSGFDVEEGDQEGDLTLF